MKCNHDLSERETACADGMCPICLSTKLTAANAKYHDLIFEVGKKHPNETRHETAKRYLREAEASNAGPAAEKDAELYRQLREGAYVFGSERFVETLPEERVTLWLHGDVPLDNDGIDEAIGTVKVEK